MTGDLWSPMISARGFLTALPREFFFKPRFHRQPLGIDDAEIDRMPDAGGGADHVIAEDAFFLGAEAEDSVPRALVQRVGLEFDADAAERLEGVTQHQVLGFGVD